MKSIIKKSIGLATVFIITSSLGCSKPAQVSNTTNYSISNFKLDQLDENGDPLFTLTSSKAVVDPIDTSIKVNDVIIDVHSDRIVFKKIRALNCIIDKKNNKILLDNDVRIEGFKDPNSILKAHSINWDVNKKTIFVEGDIDLRYLNTNIQSKNAFYNLDTEQFIFTGLTKYYVFTDNTRSNPLINLESTYAKIDNTTKSIEFKSSGSQVLSIINIDSL